MRRIISSLFRGSVPRLALRDEQGERHHGIVLEARPPIGELEQAVAAQVLKEEQRPDPLVPIGERVILDHEVEQMRGTRLRSRVQRLRVEGLFDGGEDRIKVALAFAAEERRSRAPLAK